MFKQIEPEKIPYNWGIQSLCKLKYYKHPHGCPNHGVREDCPPNQPLINEVLDFEKEIYVIIGVWGTWETARTYYIDNVKITAVKS